MTDLAAIVGALDREHRTNVPAHFLIAADHPARLECPTCALLADTPSVEPPTPFGALLDAIAEHEARLAEKVGPNEAKRLAQPLYDFAWSTPLRVRPSVEPAGIDVERLFEAMYAVWPGHTEGSGGTGNVETRSWEVKDPAVLHRGLVEAIAAEYAALLPTQASDSPEPKETT